MKIAGFLFFLIIPFLTFSQSITLEGQVTDPLNNPLEHAHVHMGKLFVTTSKTGKYYFENVKPGTYNVNISYIGFKNLDTLVTLRVDTVMDFTLKEETASLNEVVLSGIPRRKVSHNVEKVTGKFIQDQFAGSLAKTLEQLPGVNSLEIGAGTSKPIIRGLGFNRIAVSEQGIKQEGQQWGADHGLEIDALNAESVEVVKGVGAIEHGSDAIGGVIKIINDQVPQKGLSGEVVSLAQSVNNRITSAGNVSYRKNKFFYKLKATASEFGDYAVPTDNIIYLNRNIPVYNERLKNTAGRENDLYGQIGYFGPHYKGTISLSNVYFKSGFFPGAHGIPSLRRVEDDKDRRDIDFPFQRVNHRKAISKNEWYYHDYNFELTIGYQNNHRQEWSYFHTHYSGQKPPAVDPDLELDFDLHTYDAQGAISRTFGKRHTSKLGVQHQIQDNTIGGYNFLLPEYFRTTTGLYYTHNFEATENLTLSLGTRYDYSKIQIEEYFDDLLYQYLLQRGRSSSEAAEYATRSPELDKNFSNYNVMAGLLYYLDQNWDFSVNAGTSFRLPTAIELGANGVHHGSFRHEKGDINLDPEKGYVIDTQINYSKDSFRASVSPYLYFFDNYIFLNPSGIFSILPHTGQVYQFTQSEAVLTGFELELEKNFFGRLNTHFNLEYIYNQQVTKDRTRNYPLPFTPPLNGFGEVGYEFLQDSKSFKESEFFINTNFAMEQSRIAQQELITPGYVIFGGGVKTGITIGKFEADINASVSNIFNTKYFNHTNFYRAIEIPEMGRNIQVMLRVPFNK